MVDAHFGSSREGSPPRKCLASLRPVLGSLMCDSTVDFSSPIVCFITAISLAMPDIFRDLRVDGFESMLKKGYLTC